MRRLVTGLLALLFLTDITWAQITDEAAKRREDIAQYRRQFFEVDRSYSPAARQEAEKRLAALEAQADNMDPAAFDLALARITALADNGHTVNFAAPRSRRYERVDMRLVPFGDQFYVLRVKATDGGESDILGARLVAIDGVPIETLREWGRSLVGGTNAWRDRSVPYFLESPPQLHALGVGKTGMPPLYRFATPDGKTIERRFSVSPAGAARVGGSATRWMSPALAPLEDRAWKTLIAAEAAPWSVQDPVKRFRWRYDAALDALVLDMRQSSNAGEEKLADFFAAVEMAVGIHKPRHLVLDLRMNGGGDLTTTRDFAERLPTWIKGRVFALTSPWTFSAAISTLGYLKQAAPDRVTIVGEPVGDRLHFFAEGRSVTLAHSKEVVLFATERHDYIDGCKKYDDCHRPVVRRPIAVRTLDPDIPAPWTIEAYRQGRDPGMEAVAAALGAAGATGKSRE